MRPYNTRNTNNIPQFKIKHFFRIFFPSVVTEWNKLDQNICNTEDLIIFKKRLLKSILPSGSSAFRCDSSKGVKLHTRLRLVLSHFTENKFKQIHLTQNVAAVKTVKRQLISFFAVLIVPMKD